MSAPRHFIDLWETPAGALRDMLDEARRRKAARLRLPRGTADPDAPLAGRTLAMIFEKNSTRTRVSFDMAMRQLGGSALALNAADMQLGRGETIDDTARVLSSYVDAVMLRARRHEDVTAFAAASRAPVINGLTDRSHPCQIMADLQTLEEAGLQLAGARIAWMGDGNNVAASFIHAAPKFGFSLVVSGPPGYDPREDDVARARAEGGRVEIERDPARAAAGADVVVADTFVSMGDVDADRRLAELGPWRVTAELMARANPGAVFLHCLPAHRGEEVDAEVIDGPRSRAFEAAENRLHAQKAILMWCLGA
jgi:ornithine carbamoyltransferase